MRRKTRYVLTGAAITGGLALTGEIIRQWFAKNETGDKLTLQNFDGKRALKTTLLWAGIGGLGGNLFYEYEIYQERKEVFNPDVFLQQILTDEYLKNDPKLLEKTLRYRRQIKEWMVQEFSNLLAANPQDAGSFVKRTAIYSNYDLDIILPFRRSSFISLKDMFYCVYDAAYKKFSRKAKVVKQRKTIGLIFQFEDTEIYFDIIPGREIESYQEDKKLNLYVRPDWIWQTGTSFKANIGIQRKITVNQPEARRVIKLLKCYRDRNNLYLPTTIVEQSVIAALSKQNFGVAYSVAEDLLNSMYFLAKVLKRDSLPDISNSNNNLYNKMNGWERSLVSWQLLNDLERIEDNPRYIREIFHA